MKQLPRRPTTPRSAQETVRHEMIALLRERACTAQELSTAVRIAEKEVYGHLEHIRRSIHATGGVLEVIPASCRHCGFTFVKRDRLTSPGRCPVCRHEAIHEPLFVIRGEGTAGVGREGSDEAP